MVSGASAAVVQFFAQLEIIIMTYDTSDAASEFRFLRRLFIPEPGACERWTGLHLEMELSEGLATSD